MVENIFIEGVHQLGLQLNDAQIEQFLRYQQELIDWNTRINLTAITEPQDIQLKHFLDSLTLLSAFDAPVARLLDIGSGAGFPGLPLKIVRPQWQVTLLEATGKKVTFLQHMIGVLQLEGIVAIHGRAEELAHKSDYRGCFDVVTARAVSALPSLLEYCVPYCRVGGVMIFPKKGDLAEEIAQGKRAAAQVGATLQASVPVTVPGLADGRCLLVWRQQKQCPPQTRRKMKNRISGEA